MAARPKRSENYKAMRLAWWNADRGRGTKFQLEYILSQQCVDICLLSETFLNPSGLPTVSDTAQTGGELEASKSSWSAVL